MREAQRRTHRRPCTSIIKASIFPPNAGPETLWSKVRVLPRNVRATTRTFVEDSSGTAWIKPPPLWPMAYGPVPWSEPAGEGHAQSALQNIIQLASPLRRGLALRSRPRHQSSSQISNSRADLPRMPRRSLWKSVFSQELFNELPLEMPLRPRNAILCCAIALPAGAGRDDGFGCPRVRAVHVRGGAMDTEWADMLRWRACQFSCW